MYSIAFKRPLVTLAVVSGLLAAAAPASAKVESPKDTLSGAHARYVGAGSDGINRAGSDGTSNTLIVAEVVAPTGTPETANIASDGLGASWPQCIRVGDGPNVIASGAVKPARDSTVTPRACDAASKEATYFLSSALGTQSP